MTGEYIKVLTDSAIIINRLRDLLEEASVTTRVSDRVESARLGGFGSPTNSVELFILIKDIDKASPIVEAYKEKINS